MTVPEHVERLTACVALDDAMRAAVERFRNLAQESPLDSQESDAIVDFAESCINEVRSALREVFDAYVDHLVEMRPECVKVEEIPPGHSH